MNDPQQIQTVQRLSANDVDLKIICWLVEEGSFVKKGTYLCSVESNKAVSDVQADFEGFVYFLVGPGEVVGVGKPVVIFSDQKDDRAKSNFVQSKKAGIPLTENNNAVDSQESIIQMGHKRYAAHEKLNKDINLHLLKRVIILGAGVGAAQLVDLALRSKQEIVGLLDDDVSLHGRTVLDQKILGPMSMIHQLWKNGSFDGVIISFHRDLNVRKKAFNELAAAGIPFTNLIDPSAQFNSNVILGVGNVILAGAVFGAAARLGNNNIIGTHNVIEHHSVVGDGCSFGPGVMTSGEVMIGDEVRFGTGIFIEPRISIGSRSTISSGCIVTINIAEDTIVKKDMDYKIVKKTE